LGTNTSNHLNEKSLFVGPISLAIQNLISNGNIC
jgi:hypothetical protein